MRGFVGAAIGGRRGERYLDGFRVGAGYGVVASAGMDADSEGAAVGYIVGDGGRVLVHAGGGWRLPKRAVPTRTQVLPSSMATGKSFDMPMESWVRLGWAFCASSRRRRSSRK
jgi:hypothetical protein